MRLFCLIIFFETALSHSGIVASPTHALPPLPTTAFMEPDRLQKRFRQRRSTTANLTDFDSDFMGTEQLQRSSNSRSKRQIPHIIYPEILVIVDYDGYRLHGGDNVQVSGGGTK